MFSSLKLHTFSVRGAGNGRGETRAQEDGTKALSRMKTEHQKMNCTQACQFVLCKLKTFRDRSESEISAKSSNTLNL